MLLHKEIRVSCSGKMRGGCAQCAQSRLVARIGSLDRKMAAFTRVAGAPARRIRGPIQPPQNSIDPSKGRPLPTPPSDPHSYTRYNRILKSTDVAIEYKNAITVFSDSDHKLVGGGLAYVFSQQQYATLVCPDPGALSNALRSLSCVEYLVKEGVGKNVEVSFKEAGPLMRDEQGVSYRALVFLVEESDGVQQGGGPQEQQLSKVLMVSKQTKSVHLIRKLFTSLAGQRRVSVQCVGPEALHRAFTALKRIRRDAKRRKKILQFVCRYKVLPAKGMLSRIGGYEILVWLRNEYRNVRIIHNVKGDELARFEEP